MANKNGNCPIWGGRCEIYLPTAKNPHYYVEGSLRSGVPQYEISPDSYYAVADLDDKQKARLTSVLVAQSIQGVEHPRITLDDVIRAKENKNLPVAERRDRLLRLVANDDKVPMGRSFNLEPPLKGRFLNRLFGPISSMYELGLAWSESTRSQELKFLIDELVKKGMIARTERPKRRQDDEGYDPPSQSRWYKVQFQGYQYIESLDEVSG